MDDKEEEKNGVANSPISVHVSLFWACNSVILHLFCYHRHAAICNSFISSSSFIKLQCLAWSFLSGLLPLRAGKFWQKEFLFMIRILMSRVPLYDNLAVAFLLWQIASGIDFERLSGKASTTSLLNVEELGCIQIHRDWLQIFCNVIWPNCIWNVFV